MWLENEGVDLAICRVVLPANEPYLIYLSIGFVRQIIRKARMYYEIIYH